MKEHRNQIVTSSWECDMLWALKRTASERESKSREMQGGQPIQPKLLMQSHLFDQSKVPNGWIKGFLDPF